MSDPAPPKPAGVKRIIFKQIVEGDLRKFRAESNDAATGGGARDLRFRPHDKFEKAFAKLFPTVRRMTRKRAGGHTTVDIYYGRLYWTDASGNQKSSEASYEPPTDARPNEGRIPVVYQYPPLNNLPRTDQGKILLLLIQRDDNTVWPCFATEDSLRSGDWDANVSRPLIRCLDAKRSLHKVAIGFIDFENGTSYSDA